MIPMVAADKDVIKNAADDFVDAERMVESAMLGAVERQICRAELLDAAQALELFCADQIPDDFVANMYVSMHWIFKHFFFMKLPAGIHSALLFRFQHTSIIRPFEMQRNS